MDAQCRYRIEKFYYIGSMGQLFERLPRRAEEIHEIALRYGEYVASLPVIKDYGVMREYLERSSPLSAPGAANTAQDTFYLTEISRIEGNDEARLPEILLP